MTVLYSPYDPACQEDPYPIYRQLRDEFPVYYNEELNFWAISRFEDVWNVIHDPGRFSSAGGIVVGDDALGAAGDLLPMMIAMDPPRHDQLRSLVNRGFTPRRIAAMEEDIRKTARELLEEVRGGESFDLVPSFAAPLPTIVIADLIGVSRDDRKWFRECSDVLVQANPTDPDSIEATTATAMSLYEYFGDIIADRRRTPRDDMVTALVQAEVDGQHLTEEELRGFCFLLLLAGNETTTNLISNSANLFAANPDQRREVREDPELLPGAIEEFLRFDSPVQGLARTMTEDVEMHGQTLREGQKALVLFGSANRDEREFPNPDSVDIRRKIERSVAFGHGVHYCLGASLARMEGRVAYEEILPMLGDFEVDLDSAKRLNSGPIRGFLHLTVSPGKAS